MCRAQENQYNKFIDQSSRENQQPEPDSNLGHNYFNKGFHKNRSEREEGQPLHQNNRLFRKSTIQEGAWLHGHHKAQSQITQCQVLIPDNEIQPQLRPKRCNFEKER